MEALLAPGLFFYHHIAKTAGTSWSVDIAKLGGLHHCNTSHVVGPHSLEQLADSVTSAVLARRRRLSTGCNLFNREGGLASSVLRFSLHDVEPKLILLLRDPVWHVRSMYSHCQAPTAVYRQRKETVGSHRGIRFLCRVAQLIRRQQPERQRQRQPEARPDWDQIALLLQPNQLSDAPPGDSRLPACRHW